MSELLKDLDNKREGLIFNIQRFSIHDGPGIRTTVFMKGCPLNCRWCSNPESQKIVPELIVRDVNCRGCGECIRACPREAITVSIDEGRKIDWSNCDGCLKCVDFCIYNSLNVSGERKSLEDVLEEVLRDKSFYNNSGGGITISGGEPLVQIEFVENLLRSCKDNDIHTALDTSGYTSWEILEKLLFGVDLLLFDIKHLDPEVHKKFTGVDNGIILSNFTKAAKYTPLWLRIPLIEGFNDSKKHIEKVARLAAENNVEKVSLLPYHEGGKAKSFQIGKAYELPLARAPEDENVTAQKELIESYGLKVSINS